VGSVAQSDGARYHSVEPTDLPEFLQKLNRSGAEDDIAVAGRQITARHHSLQASAKQIARCLDALKRRTYRGARWRYGEFLIEEQ